MKGMNHRLYIKHQLFCFSALLLFSVAYSQDRSQFQKQWFIQGGDTLPYRIMLPKNYDTAKKYPVVFFLHGRGESGNDNEKQLTNGSEFFLRDSIRDRYPAIVVFPQCSAKSYWSNVNMVTYDSSTAKRWFYFIPGGSPTLPMQLLQNLVNNVLERFSGNRQQVYVGGLSMGAMGTYELVRRMPNTFAAAFAICGGAHPATAPQLKQTAWWIFHGLKDDVVPPEKSRIIADALISAGAKVKATFYPTANHNSWDPAFAEPQLMHWLFSNKMK